MGIWPMFTFFLAIIEWYKYLWTNLTLLYQYGLERKQVFKPDDKTKMRVNL